MKLLSIVFSFRNEQSNLEELVKRTALALKKLNNWNFELIFVNEYKSTGGAKVLKEMVLYYDQLNKTSEQVDLLLNKLSGKYN